MNKHINSANKDQEDNDDDTCATDSSNIGREWCGALSCDTPGKWYRGILGCC